MMSQMLKSKQQTPPVPGLPAGDAVVLNKGCLLSGIDDSAFEKVSSVCELKYGRGLCNGHEFGVELLESTIL